MSSKFEILIPSPAENRSFLCPATAAKRGVAFQESATLGSAELADGLKQPVLFITRDSVVGGPPLADHVYPGRLELPFATGQEASFEPAQRVQVQGSDHLVLSGADLIAEGTALESDLSFNAGKFCVKQSGQLVLYKLKGVKTLASHPTDIEPGNTFAIVAERVLA